LEELRRAASRVTPTAPSTVHVVRILLLEDSPADAHLIRKVLEADGLPFALELVDEEKAFRDACARGGMDVILSDFQLPGFDGWAALETARRLRPDVPFIFVSGVIGEEMAVDSLREGAAVFVLKDGLSRLAPAVRRVVAGREAQFGLRRA
jgi:CheY-like chemotaxis protein